MTEYELTEEEIAVYNWQFGLQGDFFTALWNAIIKADAQNLAQLSLAFPNEVSGYQKYTRQNGWWEQVVKKWDARHEVDIIKNTARDQIPLLKEMKTDIGKEYLSHRLKEEIN